MRDSNVTPGERTSIWPAALLVGAASIVGGCSGGLTDDRDSFASANAESCMLCHNGSSGNDYAGPGMPDPHPFPGASGMSCTTCHGGNPAGTTALTAHVPPPPSIGDRERLDRNAEAYFNRLTLTGLDKLPDYEDESGRTHTALDYLQFINPGDVRVVSQNRSCGTCHTGHADVVENSILYTATGIFGGTANFIGATNRIPTHIGLFNDTASDLAFRETIDPTYVLDLNRIGQIKNLVEYPVYSRREISPDSSFRNDDYNAAGLSDDQDAQRRVLDNSPLHRLFMEQVAFTCGDCHLGSAGANNRSGDYRSAGCTACHMPYSITGRYGDVRDHTGARITPVTVDGRDGLDPNLNRLEPYEPDDIDDPELPHVREHRIVSVKRTLSNGAQVGGIDDYTCAGCHQGSNRTVMQYWGIRLDQNEDLRRRVQYPADPVSFETTRNDPRLFVEYVHTDRNSGDREIRRTREFNGRDHDQYILSEDYDGDTRDDTPPDIHYEAGMGCIDCHGSYDLHGGDPDNPGTDGIASRMEHAVAITCESCHGTVDAYATTTTGLNYAGETVELAVDSKGRVLRHLQRESDGHFYMYSRLTGAKHFVVQTRDVTVDTGVLNPNTNLPVFSEKASYAMGRDDGDAATGTGPKQTGSTSSGFSHSDNMTCSSCHGSWTNSCVGCHLIGEYNEGNNFSNITGERIAFREDEADFVYQSPVMFQLGVGVSNKIEQFSANTKTFFTYRDRNDNTSQVFTFSDRNAQGSNPAVGFPALGHNKIMPHSIRGKVSATNEGPRYCVACHLTDQGLTTYGAQYNTFRARMAANDFANLDYNMLQQHIGLNTGNHLNSPMWVHMVSGLGSGLFLFDENGAPMNPLDDDNDREPYEVAPNTRFDPARVAFNLDTFVRLDGTPTGSNNHPMLNPGATPNLRDGAPDPEFAGPLGATLLQRLTDPTTGIVLDSWLDADGAEQGDAATNIR